MVHRFVLIMSASLLGTTPVLSQSWAPTGVEDPWGPHGSQICSAGPGDANRFCMAVFCAEPGAPLAFGYSNAPFFDSGPGDLPIELNVDYLQSWQTSLSLQTGFGYLVGAVPLDPGALPGFYQSIRAGSRLYLDDGAGNVWGLPLRRSDTEMQRLAEICAPVRPLELNEIEITLIGPRRADGPPEIEAIVGPDPDGPTTLEDLNALRNSNPRGSEATSDATAVNQGVRSAAALAAATPPPDQGQSGPPIPGVPALLVGAADWQSVPPMDEPVYGTRLCFPEARDGEPERCLNLICFEGWKALNILYQDAAFPAEEWRGSAEFGIVLSNAAGAAVSLPLLVNPDAETLIATGLAQDVDWQAVLALLKDDGPLRFDLPYGASTVMAGNAAAEIPRMLAQCETPE